MPEPMRTAARAIDRGGRSLKSGKVGGVSRLLSCSTTRHPKYQSGDCLVSEVSSLVGADALNTRTQNSSVHFRKAFALSGLDGMQPPGIYHLQRYEILLDTITAPAYRHMSTTIELHDQPAGVIRTATVDPLELDEALARDKASADAVAPSDVPTWTEAQNAGAPHPHKARLGAASVGRDTHATGSVLCRGSGSKLDESCKAVLVSLDRWGWRHRRKLVWSVLASGGVAALTMIL